MKCSRSGSSHWCSSDGSLIPEIEKIQNAHSDLSLIQNISLSGSIYNRSGDNSLSLVQDYWDFYSASPSETLSFVSQASVAKVAPVGVSSSLVFNHSLTVAGGRITTGPEFYDVIYDPAAVSPAQVGSWVYVNSSGNAILATSAGTLPQAEVVGCLMEEGIASQLTEVLTQGRLTLDDWTSLAGTEFLTPGVIYYLTTGGLMSAVAPSSGYVVVLGRAITNIEFDVSVQLPWGVE
jgi:hypothetical protein